jgi:hypothetical protein
MSIADKLSYLNDTKEGLRIAINQLGGRLTKTTPFRNYADGLNYLYSKIPKVEAEGENITFNDVASALMKLDLKGNTSQSGTPTPTSPIPVSVVSGDNEVKIFGKNIYDFLNNTYTKEPHLTITKLDNGYTITNSGSGNERILFQNLSVDSAKTYVLSFEINNPSGARVEVGWVGSGKTILSTATSGRLSSALTGITTSAFSMYVGANATITFTNIMLCEGNDTSTPYEPYQSQTYEVDLGTLELCKIGTYQDYFTKNSGKNLFDKDNVVKVENKILNDSGVEVNDNGGAYTKMYMPVKPNTTYTTRGMPNGGTNRVYFFDNTKTFISRTSGYTNLSSFSFTTPANCYFIDIQYYMGNNNFNIWQIEEGTTATTYEPYGTGQWCKYNAIGKVVYDENTSFSGYNTSTHSFVKYNPFEIKDKSSYSSGTKAPEILSNYYTSVNWNDFINGTKGLTLYYANNTLQIRLSSDLTTISDYQTWLSTHNVEILYPLATPYLSLIEDNNLIEQLDNLENAMSYEGQTNISQVNNDKPFIISAKALTEIVFEGGE